MTLKHEMFFKLMMSVMFFYYRTEYKIIVIVDFKMQLE